MTCEKKASFFAGLEDSCFWRVIEILSYLCAINRPECECVAESIESHCECKIFCKRSSLYRRTWDVDHAYCSGSKTILFESDMSQNNWVIL